MQLARGVAGRTTPAGRVKPPDRELPKSCTTRAHEGYAGGSCSRPSGRPCRSEVPNEVSPAPRPVPVGAHRVRAVQAQKPRAQVPRLAYALRRDAPRPQGACAAISRFRNPRSIGASAPRGRPATSSFALQPVGRRAPTSQQPRRQPHEAEASRSRPATRATHRRQAATCRGKAESSSSSSSTTSRCDGHARAGLRTAPNAQRAEPAARRRRPQTQALDTPRRRWCRRRPTGPASASHSTASPDTASERPDAIGAHMRRNRWRSAATDRAGPRPALTRVLSTRPPTQPPPTTPSPPPRRPAGHPIAAHVGSPGRFCTARQRSRRTPQKSTVLHGRRWRPWRLAGLPGASAAGGVRSQAGAQGPPRAPASRPPPDRAVPPRARGPCLRIRSAAARRDRRQIAPTAGAVAGALPYSPPMLSGRMGGDARPPTWPAIQSAQPGTASSSPVCARWSTWGGAAACRARL